MANNSSAIDGWRKAVEVISENRDCEDDSDLPLSPDETKQALEDYKLIRRIYERAGYDLDALLKHVRKNVKD